MYPAFSTLEGLCVTLLRYLIPSVSIRKVRLWMNNNFIGQIAFHTCEEYDSGLHSLPMHIYKGLKKFKKTLKISENINFFLVVVYICWHERTRRQKDADATVHHCHDLPDLPSTKSWVRQHFHPQDPQHVATRQHFRIKASCLAWPDWIQLSHETLEEVVQHLETSTGAPVDALTTRFNIRWTPADRENCSYWIS